MKGVIFDLDGTLIDSMWIWDAVDRKVLTEYGKEPMEDYEEAVSCLNFSQCVRYIQETYQLPLSREALSQRIHDLAYEEYAKIYELKPGAKEWIYYLKQEGYKIGLTTSCLRKMSERVLQNAEVFQLFDTFVYSDEFGKNKSEPDIYIRTAELLGIECPEIMVFEDLPYGAESAKSAGMQVVGVYDVQNFEQKKMLTVICDFCIHDFYELLTKKEKFLKK